MKKTLILTGLLCCMSGVAHAATGDVVDHIYSTDIRAFINGVEVESYAIDGKTVVVVEDVTRDYSYNDQLRTLLIGGFAPYFLNEGSAEHSDAPGRIIGDVYETDIKTYIYDDELTAYALNGKTAVALEDLGGDQAWSETGGKYKWDPDARTISLETLYGNISDYVKILYDTNAADVTITVNDDRMRADAVVSHEKYSAGGGTYVHTPQTEEEPNVLVPIFIKIDGEEVWLGWYFGHSSKNFELVGYLENGEVVSKWGFAYYEGAKEVYEEIADYRSTLTLDTDVLRAAAQTLEVEELTAREGVIGTWLGTHACTMQEQFDTDNYTFAYMTQGTPHGANTILLLIQDDGTYHNYWDDFESVSLYGTKWFENVKIDRENEKVYFRYDTDYVIDLKTGKLEKAE